MGLLRLLITQCKIRVFESIFTRKITINLDKPIFSFSFDDVPISALTNGARILEEANIRGTYYIALGMEGHDEQERPLKDDRKFLDEPEIIALYNRGHDISCHTYSHLNTRKSSIQMICNDCDKNIKLLSKMIDGPIEHFAYPFGLIGFRGKQVLRNKYKSLRTTDFGVNCGKTDMAHLRAISLSSISLNKEKILSAINDTLQGNCWTIFFTHDVKENPSQWGTSIDDFQWVIDRCVETEADILNIKQAYNKISSLGG